MIAATPLAVRNFLAWVKDAAPGDIITYHEGLLGIDRTAGPSALPETFRAELNRVAGHAMALAEDGCLLLVQRRIADGHVAYLAIKARGDKSRRICP
ncbi:MAG: hypothetical protein K2Q10_08000 [Rhodospirillales bacterium]|nr:hypothetical protein [Rhodospirillales bacterium]